KNSFTMGKKFWKKFGKKKEIDRLSAPLPTIHEREPKKKSANYRYIRVVASSTTQKFEKQMDFRIPHFVLHDFSDGEESKVIRMILTYARMPYECRDINRDDFILEDYPFYSLPMLEVNERKLGNVPSICRQLGWRYELSGQKYDDDSEVDMIAEKTYEARMRIKNWLDHLDHREDHECDETCDGDDAIAYLESSLLPTIEHLLRRSSTPWISSHKMTWCDLLVACLFNPIIYHCPRLFDRYPNVFLHNKRIAQMDEFAGFLYNVRERRYSH
uniref:GST N-terminal domain-containing protein n=1 Tax=Haemonchus contortus TaxID=6289 RepID=A0A7I4YYM7_HAECO